MLNGQALPQRTKRQINGYDRITRNIYDAAGQLTQVQKAYGTPLVQTYATYTYSDNGKQTSIVDAGGNKATRNVARCAKTMSSSAIWSVAACRAMVLRIAVIMAECLEIRSARLVRAICSSVVLRDSIQAVFNNVPNVLWHRLYGIART